MPTQFKRLSQILVVSCCCWLLLTTRVNAVAVNHSNPTMVFAQMADGDGDQVPDAQEDRNRDGNLVNDDSDQDGISDYLDTDDENDGVPTRLEDPNNTAQPVDDDSDGDGLANYLDADDDADATLTVLEDLNQNGDLTDDDRDGDTIPAYLDPIDSAGTLGDSDNDGLPDAVECPQLPCHNSDHDHRPDYMDGDDDDDGLPTMAEIINGASHSDADRDGAVDYLDAAEAVRTEAATLGDLVWLDIDQDGIQDSAETSSQRQGWLAGVPGLSITLYKALSAMPVATTRSDGAGRYRFTNVLAGQYFMEFVAPQGYTFTAADQGEESFDSDALRVTASVARTALITVTPGLEQPAIDVGLWLTQQQRASLGGRIWYDANQNGVQEATETGIGGVAITLFNQDEVAVATAYSDNTGVYQFANLPAGVYALAFVPRLAYAMTALGQGGDHLMGGNTTTHPGRTGLITLAPGVYDDSWNIGLYLVNATAQVHGRLWYDQDGNGQQEGAAGGVTGVQIDLLTSNRQWIATTMTDDAGQYSFTNLVADNYLLAIQPPPGYQVSPHTQEDAHDDNDFYPASGRTAPILLLPGATPTVRNGGLYLVGPENHIQTAAAVAGQVWEDQNRNGLQDSNEQPIKAVVVRLYDAQGRLRHSTITDEAGRYQMVNLAPGAYRLAFLSLKGQVPTLVDQGTTDMHDSDVDPHTGRTSTIVLTSGEMAEHWDAGLYFQPTAIALSRFQATFQQSQLLVQWQTTTELDTIGYFVVASATPIITGAKPLNRERIASLGSAGGSYAVTLPYNPAYLTPLDQLQLWLIEVAADGTETPWGPIGVTRTAQFLPLALR